MDLGGDGVVIPLLLVRGGRPGKTLVVTAGVHGDEFEGVRAIMETYDELDPNDMRGDVLAVPVANPPAFWNRTRTSPLDGSNLARSFPGTESGTPTQLIAFHLGRSIIARGDFYLDLHSAGIKLLMPSMVGFAAHDARACEAAKIFGAPVLWAHPSISPGRTISLSTSLHIPSLYTEARGAGRISPDDLKMFKRGIRNLLFHLSILEGSPEVLPIEHYLEGGGDIDASVSASHKGFFVPSVELLEEVRANQYVGKTVNLYGQEVEKFISPRDGVIGMIHALPVVQAGDSVFLITGKHKQELRRGDI
ncbi:MAG TPA: succinylglutamate desuccinylase/aspartoacylase family protein [Terriglobales bacterium]|nr:succinylglutamate desuccinylase/aspartoacylase family protein [Terriglobales bacterium]